MGFFHGIGVSSCTGVLSQYWFYRSIGVSRQYRTYIVLLGFDHNVEYYYCIRVLLQNQGFIGVPLWYWGVISVSISLKCQGPSTPLLRVPAHHTVFTGDLISCLAPRHLFLGLPWGFQPHILNSLISFLLSFPAVPMLQDSRGWAIPSRTRQCSVPGQHPLKHSQATDFPASMLADVSRDNVTGWL